MCGIAGFVDFTKKSGQATLERMTACMPHRGPDGQGAYFHEHNHAAIGLGHRRLSIIDLSHAADQPMHFDGLHIIFNGEIYNYQEIRDELSRLGHHFITHSDTEVILHSWRQWGGDSIYRWHGMFSICLFDEKSEEIVCIRDRAGVKPFFYYWKDDVFLFCSELKSMVNHPSFQKEIDSNAVASFLQYGYVPQPHCIYRNTFKLQAGYLLRVSLNSKNITTRQYWNVYDHYNKPKLKIGLPEVVEQTEKILEKAFQYRMVADVPVGVFLSGGYDSTCVTALLQKNSMAKIKTFTIGMDYEQLNEAPFAKQVAAHLGTEHTEYYCSSKDALDIIPQLPFFYDEPFADSSAIPTILVSKMARQQVTVALSADAGDEIFAGYNRYDYITRYGKKIAAMPKALRKMAVVVMENVSSENIPYFNKKYNFHSRYDKLKALLNNPSTSELLKNLSHVFNGPELAALMANPFVELSTLHFNQELKYDDPLAFMMAIDWQTYLVDDILQKTDRATMSVSLEGREPFLDQSIIEWAAQLPSGYKYYQGQKKYPLKQIVHKYVPAEMMERPKMGFGIPIENWLGKELKEYVMENLSEKRLNAHGFFKAGEVNKLLAEFYNGRKEKHLKIWYILMFQLWFKKWMG